MNEEIYEDIYVHCSIIYSSQDMETTEVSINGWMDKVEVVYIYIIYNLYIYMYIPIYVYMYHILYYIKYSAIIKIYYI